MNMEILIAGNAAYWKKEQLKEFFREDTVVLSGRECQERKRGKFVWYSAGVEEERFEALFSTYHFDRVIYMSSYLTCGRRPSGEGELESLQRLLALCRRNGVMQILYLTSLNECRRESGGRALILKTAEQLCLEQAEKNFLPVRILRCPWLAGPSVPQDYWYRMFSGLSGEGKWDFSRGAEEPLYFLDMRDLGEFLVRLFDGWDSGAPVMELKACPGTYGGLVKALEERFPRAKLEMEAGSELRDSESGRKDAESRRKDVKSELRNVPDSENLARTVFGWFPRIDVVRYLDEYWEAYAAVAGDGDASSGARRSVGSTGSGIRGGARSGADSGADTGISKAAQYSIGKKRLSAFRQGFSALRQRLSSMERLTAFLELALGAVLMEALQRILGSTAQFRMIDVRLLFVVCMASMYGLNMGVWASVAAIASLCLGYYREGYSWLVLFYEPSNWIPFILYLVAGAVCGFSRDKREEENAFIQKENSLLQEKYAFLSRLYQEALEYKNQYKKQIIGSRDSFGRIFDVVKQLDTMLPEKIFAETIPVLEDVLENKTVAIYSIYDQDARYGRLEVCSRPVSEMVNKSIRLADYGQALEAVKAGQVWFNRDLEEGLPLYMAGVRVQERLTVLIMIYRAEYAQVGMYYANLIRILSGLIESSFARAWEYQRAMRENTYLGETAIAREDYFLEQIHIRHRMYENHLASYRLLQLDMEGRSLEEMDELLRSRVRGNDLLGMGEDGKIYLLMTQVDKSSENIVLRRFQEAGVKCRIVSQIGG